MKTKSRIKTTKQDNGLLSGQYGEAVTALDRLLEIEPHMRYQGVDGIERALVRLRDNLIDQLRQNKSPAETRRLRAKLDQANVAISLIMGVEYPAAGIQQQLLDQAYEVLKKMPKD